MEELTFQRDETEFHGMGQNGLRAASTYVFCLPPAINCQRLHDTTIIITTNYKSQF
jgi:hypothetical protein